MRRAIALSIACLVAAAAAPARADVENGLGLGAEAQALGGAVSAVPLGFASAHYNPAMIPIDTAPGAVEATLGFVFAKPLLYIERLDDGEELEPATDPYGTAAAYVGARFDLGRPFGLDGLHAALALYSPLAHLFAYAQHPDDRVQWLMHTDRTQAIGIHFGLGYRVAEWLSLGVGMRVLFDLEVFTTGEISSIRTETDPETGMTITRAETRLGEDVRVLGRPSPIAGVTVTPMTGARVALVWRGETYVDDWGWAQVEAPPGLGNLGYGYRFAHYYRPHELALGAAYAPMPSLELSLDVTWAMWSTGLTSNQADLPGRWGDTIVPALGARYTAKRGIDVLAGYRYVRSPFDNFGGPTNLVDNDQHALSAGTELRLAELVGSHVPFTVNASVRFAWLPEREERKDWRRFASDEDLARNPGAPAYRHGGVIPSAQIGVEAAW